MGDLSVAGCVSTWESGFKLSSGRCQDMRTGRSGPSDKVLECMIDTQPSCARACSVNSACAAFDREEEDIGNQPKSYLHAHARAINAKPSRCCLYAAGDYAGNGDDETTCYLLRRQRIVDLTSSASKGLLPQQPRMIGNQLLECANSICACNMLKESDFCARSCAKLPRNGGMIGRSNLLGRVLWCLAQREDVHVAIDMFMNTGGGSTRLIASGLERSRKKAGLLFGFELDSTSVDAAVGTYLAEWHPVRTTPDSLPSPEQLQQWQRENLTIVIVNGMPFPYETHIESKLDFPWSSEPPVHLPVDRAVPLEYFCNHVGPIDLVFLNPTFAVVGEWQTLEKSCMPRMVVIANVNLPFHAGWIKQRLQDAGWSVVLEGHYSVEVFATYARRDWVVLLRPDAMHWAGS